MKVSFKDVKGDLGVVEINAHLRRKIFTVQLSRSVPKGHILLKDDLRIAQIWSNGKEEKFATQFRECIGFQTTKDLAVSSQIPRSSLAEPFYVRKGEIINVFSKIGNIRVEIQARALLDGKRGQVIRAKNTKSGRQIDVRMVAPLTAEIN